MKDFISVHAGNWWQGFVMNAGIGFLWESSFDRVLFVKLCNFKVVVQDSTINKTWGYHWLVDGLCRFCCELVL